MADGETGGRTDMTELLGAIRYLCFHSWKNVRITLLGFFITLYLRYFCVSVIWHWCSCPLGSGVMLWNWRRIGRWRRINFVETSLNFCYASLYHNVEGSNINSCLGLESSG
jgi:hypothetical protein